MENIISITETTFKLNESSWGSYDGFVITTDEQVINVGIENGQSCCENWGYMMSEDSFADYIGADLIKIEVVDTSLHTYELDEDGETSTMFVNFVTSNGVLQFVAYNSHNGYYGHEAVLISRTVNHSTKL